MKMEICMAITINIILMDKNKKKSNMQMENYKEKI